MQFILSFSEQQYTFASCEDAQTAQEIVRGMRPEVHTSIYKIASPLCDWTPDIGDMYSLRFLVDAGYKATAIILARMKSNSGLKEAKGWVEANF